jgi:hypothetical protein
VGSGYQTLRPRQGFPAAVERLTGPIKLVIVVCDCWDSAAFQADHHEEVGAHARHGVRFRFVLVGVPDWVLGLIPVALDQASG